MAVDLGHCFVEPVTFDDGGSSVVLRPADDPAVRPVEQALCD